jgi:spermidine synthase
VESSIIVRRRGELYHWEYATEIGGRVVYIAYPIKRILYRRRSRYQDIVVAELPVGKALILDGVTQFTTMDEELYHRAVVEPAIEEHYRRVLILGGGDGGVAREVRRLLPEAEIVVVDIDPLVTRVVERFMPEVPRGIFRDRRVRLINMDAYDYVMNVDEKFDYRRKSMPIVGRNSLLLRTMVAVA